MCRHQLPGWQQLYQAHQQDNFEILSIAVDALGAEAIRPWLDKAGATFITLLDRESVLGARHGFKVIPNGLLLDEQGVLRYARIGGFRVEDDQTLQLVKAFIADPLSLEAANAPQAQTSSATTGEWQAHFSRGVALLEQQQHAEAAAAFREALLLDPENWLVRKQLWRALHPDKFGEQIDLNWQSEQRQREAALGFADANPIP